MSYIVKLNNQILLFKKTSISNNLFIGSVLYIYKDNVNINNLAKRIYIIINLLTIFLLAVNACLVIKNKACLYKRRINVMNVYVKNTHNSFNIIKRSGIRRYYSKCTNILKSIQRPFKQL